MHPQIRQVPPSAFWRSTTAVFNPSCAARMAATYPLVPEPTTTRSNACATTRSPTGDGTGLFAKGPPLQCSALQGRQRNEGLRGRFSGWHRFGRFGLGRQPLEVGAQLPVLV